MRVFLFTAAFCYCFCFVANAQEIIFSAPFKEDRFKQYEIIGKVGNDFLVMLADLNTKQRTIQVYDAGMRIKKEYSFNQLPENTFNLNYIAYQNSLTLIYQYQKNDTTFCEATRLDSNLNSLSGPVLLDFTVASHIPLRLAYSQDKSKILLCKFNYRDSVVFLSTKVFDMQLQLQHTTFSPLTIDPVNEQLQYFRIANNGTVSFLILPVNNHAGTRLNNFEVLYNIFKTATYNSLQVQMNNKVIDADLKVEVNNFTSKLLVNSFYYTPNNIDSVAGLFTTSVDAQSNSASSIFNAFDENILSQLNTNYARMQKGRNFGVKDIIPQNNGGFILTAEVTVQNRIGIAGRNASSAATPSEVMLDRDYGSGRTTGNYGSDFPRYYLGGGFPNSTNTSSPGDTDAGNLVYDDMIITYFSDSMELINSFVVAKKQAYKYLSTAKLSFLTLNNGREIILLFNTGTVANNIIYNKSFSSGGALNLRPALKTTDVRHVLIPVYSKQVSLNQALLAFSYRGKMRFGLFNF